MYAPIYNFVLSCILMAQVIQLFQDSLFLSNFSRFSASFQDCFITRHFPKWNISYFEYFRQYFPEQSVHAIVELCFKRRVMFLRHGLCSKKTDYVRATWLMCSMFTERRFFGALATCLCFKWRVMHQKTELCFYDDQNGALARSLEHSPFFWNIVHVVKT